MGQRRHATRIEADRKRNHPDTEVERLIEFAIMWAPFGGATEEEILVRFGMTTRRFIERLWKVIPQSNCTQGEIRILASAYRTIVESAAQAADGPSPKEPAKEKTSAGNKVEQP